MCLLGKQAVSLISQLAVVAWQPAQEYFALQFVRPLCRHEFKGSVIYSIHIAEYTWKYYLTILCLCYFAR